jgi:hypothetical protein
VVGGAAEGDGQRAAQLQQQRRVARVVGEDVGARRERGEMQQHGIDVDEDALGGGILRAARVSGAPAAERARTRTTASTSRSHLRTTAWSMAGVARVRREAGAGAGGEADAGRREREERRGRSVAHARARRPGLAVRP